MLIALFVIFFVIPVAVVLYAGISDAVSEAKFERDFLR